MLMRCTKFQNSWKPLNFSHIYLSWKQISYASERQIFKFLVFTFDGSNFHLWLKCYVSNTCTNISTKPGIRINACTVMPYEVSVLPVVSAWIKDVVLLISPNLYFTDLIISGRYRDLRNFICQQDYRQKNEFICAFWIPFMAPRFD